MRTHDSGKKIYLRSDRYFKTEAGWYFNTREGIECGPFNTCLEAELGVRKYLWLKNTIDATKPANH